jgi:hypothetical protein
LSGQLFGSGHDVTRDEMTSIISYGGERGKKSRPTAVAER